MEGLAARIPRDGYRSKSARLHSVSLRERYTHRWKQGPIVGIVSNASKIANGKRGHLNEIFSDASCCTGAA